MFSRTSLLKLYITANLFHKLLEEINDLIKTVCKFLNTTFIISFSKYVTLAILCCRLALIQFYFILTLGVQRMWQKNLRQIGYV